MLVQEISTLLDRVRANLQAEVEMEHTTSDLRCNIIRISPDLVDLLPRRERRAYEGPSDEQWLLLLGLFPNMLSHAFNIEVAVATINIPRG